MNTSIEKYNLHEINYALYYNYDTKNLWLKKNQKAKQLFLEHSNDNLEMFNIPFIWGPIVYKLLAELIKVDPNIIFLQVKEKQGKLKICIKCSKIWETLIQHLIFGAKAAIDVITLTHLKLISKTYQSTTYN